MLIENSKKNNVKDDIFTKNNILDFYLHDSDCWIYLFTGKAEWERCVFINDSIAASIHSPILPFWFQSSNRFHWNETKKKKIAKFETTYSHYDDFRLSDLAFLHSNSANSDKNNSIQCSARPFCSSSTFRTGGESLKYSHCRLFFCSTRLHSFSRCSMCQWWRRQNTDTDRCMQIEMPFVFCARIKLNEHNQKHTLDYYILFALPFFLRVLFGV